MFKWPLNLSKYLTATLGETRGSYLHYGIDIKTNGRTGYPVFASSTGKIAKIISRENGYGNALFIDHGNNIQTVYGHLERFEQKKYQLNDLSKIIKILYNNKNINFSLNKSSLYFEKDEMIAASGESGAGYPHLHFEIRDNDKFMNPLDFIHIKDRNAPVIEALYLCVEKKNTTVYEKKINIKKALWKYKAAEEVKVGNIFDDERVFFKISCYDKVGTYNKLAVYRIKVLENNKKILEFAFDNLDPGDVPLGNFIYDRSKSSIKDGTSYIYNLCRKEDNNFSGYKNSGDGYIQPKTKSTDIKIQISDFAGNEVTLNFELLKDNPHVNYADGFYEINWRKSTKINSKNERIKIVIPKKAVTTESLIKMDETTDLEEIERLCKEYNLDKNDILTYFRIFPDDSYYKKPLKIILKCNKKNSDIDTSQISFYQFYKGKKPALLKTEYSSFFNSFSTETYRNGCFVLLKDSTPPEFSVPATFNFCEDEDIYRKLRLYITDNLSRVNSESIECFIDGENFPVTFDSDRDWMEVKLVRKIITEKMHHILIKAKDNADNLTVYRDLILF
ncbi:MAG: M23 family metallopeptidase [Spirochaetes bacterium]|nr:M23 family metallopeptidase [Spirochaetota bacterium]